MVTLTLFVVMLYVRCLSFLYSRHHFIVFRAVSQYHNHKLERTCHWRWPSPLNYFKNIIRHVVVVQIFQVGVTSDDVESISKFQWSVVSNGDITLLGGYWFRIASCMYVRRGVSVIHFHTPPFWPFLLYATLYSFSSPVRTLPAISAFIHRLLWKLCSLPLLKLSHWQSCLSGDTKNIL